MSATIWSGADVLLRQVLRFGVAVAMARLLSPAEFGTVAMLNLFVGVASTFVDSGFSSALIQSQNTTRRDESTVFWFNIAAAALVGLLFWSSGPSIAKFYHNPILAPLSGVFALNILVGAFGSVQYSLLSKQLNFRTPLIIGIATLIGSSTIAIILAMRGFGVWALAGQTLATTTIATVMVWILSPWRPELAFSFASFRRLFAYGGFLLGAGLINTVCSRLSSLIIGRLYSAQALGQYTRADTTQQLPTGILTGIIGRVSFPIFAAAAQDPAKLKRGFREILQGLLLVNAPAMFGLFGTAKVLVLVVFGEKWRPAIPILKILCLGGIFWPFHVLNVNVLSAQGHSKEFFRREVVTHFISVVILLISAPFGVIAIAWSQVIFSMIQVFVNGYYTGIHLNYKPMRQLIDTLPMILIAAAMGGCVSWIGLRLGQPTLLNLFALIVSGITIYVALCGLFRIPAFLRAIGMAQEALRFRGRSRLPTPTT